MGHVNPHYNPEWKKVHDHHAVERARSANERTRLIAAGAMTSDACERAKADFERHQQACLAALKARHATVQGYAAWLFGEFDVGAGGHDAGIPVPYVDFEGLRTVEEADAAWLYVKRAVTDSAEEKQGTLPSGQPDGLEAFADAASPSILRYWREFSARELWPDGPAGDGGTRTLMTVDQREDGCHVCFMHDWNGVGVSVTNAIELLATAVHREARAIAGQQAPRATGMRAWLGRHSVARTQPPSLDPARFHFYQHVPPHGSDMWEQFDRVDLSFRDGAYHATRWAGYRLIPKVIQSARFDCARDVSQSNARPGNIAVSDQRAKEGKE